jgi:hypothetical protein
MRWPQTRAPSAASCGLPPTTAPSGQCPNTWRSPGLVKLAKLHAVRMRPSGNRRQQRWTHSRSPATSRDGGLRTPSPRSGRAVLPHLVDCTVQPVRSRCSVKSSAVSAILEARPQDCFIVLAARVLSATPPPSASPIGRSHPVSSGSPSARRPLTGTRKARRRQTGNLPAEPTANRVQV